MIKPRAIIKAVIGFTLVVLFIFPVKAFCQDGFEKALSKKLDSLLAKDSEKDSTTMLAPNDAPQTLTIPSGYGGYGTYLFGALGGAYPQVYHTSADLIASGGMSIGNPFKAVNFAAGVNMTDVHRFRDFSGNFIVSRIIGNGSSISAGALQLFAPKSESDAPGQTYYMAFSHAVQSLPSETEGCSKLTYTIGIGNGRFYLKSPDDVAAGRGTHGTGVFGSVSYEVFDHVNIITEWSGMNLDVSTGFRPFESPLSFGLGVGNLTRYSGDKPNMLFTIGYPLALTRQKE
jgi:hypothetical protein